MHELCLDPSAYLASDTVSRLSRNSPGGVLFPKLGHLDWNVSRAGVFLGFFQLFLSPNLKRVILHGIPNLGTPRPGHLIPASFSRRSVLHPVEENGPQSKLCYKHKVSRDTFRVDIAATYLSTPLLYLTTGRYLTHVHCT